MGFISTISHSSECEKQRAPLDLRPIATGFVSLRAGNICLASERKTSLKGRRQQFYKSGLSCWSYLHEESLLT